MTWTEEAVPRLVDALCEHFDHDGVVVAAAAVDDHGTVTRITPVGAEAAASADTKPLEQARFEIGSVTKTMTAALIVLLDSRGLLRLDDPIGRWLSAGPHADLTIRQLATHTSGLPTVGPSRRTALVDPSDPWAGYGFEQAERDLPLTAVDPDRPRRYSNLGYQLLGLILERSSGSEYPELVGRELLEPLGMSHSSVGSRRVGPRGLGTLLTGHADGREVAQWAEPWGAGGVQATIGDLARYARACLLPPDTELGRALRLTQQPVIRTDEYTEQAMDWSVHPDGAREHSGVTGGFSAVVSVDPGRARAVALLVNYGGSAAYSRVLTETARLAIAERDLRQVAMPRPCPEWREVALETAHALLDGRFAEVHARHAEAARKRIDLHELEDRWAEGARGAGPADGVTVLHHQIAVTGAVMAQLEVAFAAGPRRLRVMVLPDGELGGISFHQ